MTMHDDPLTGLRIPKGSRSRSWRCKRGHVRKGDKPFVLDMLVDGEAVLRTSPLCAVCFRIWLEQRFGARPITAASTNNRRQRRAGAKS